MPVPNCWGSWDKYLQQHSQDASSWHIRWYQCQQPQGFRSKHLFSNTIFSPKQSGLQIFLTTANIILVDEPPWQKHSQPCEDNTCTPKASWVMIHHHFGWPRDAALWRTASMKTASSTKNNINGAVIMGIPKIFWAGDTAHLFSYSRNTVELTSRQTYESKPRALQTWRDRVNWTQDVLHLSCNRCEMALSTGNKQTSLYLKPPWEKAIQWWIHGLFCQCQAMVSAE